MPYDELIEKRFLLVDDHTIIRSALTSALRQSYGNPKIDESSVGTDIKEKLTQVSYDLIIMDIHMPSIDTLCLLDHIHLNYPGIPVLIYSMSAEKVYALRVLRAGAKGFVSKESSIDELMKAIDMAMNGKIYVSQAVAELLCLQSTKKSDTPFTYLSPRELQIVVLLLAGNTVTAISKLLHIRNSTAGTHKGNIFQKLKVGNLLELKEISDIYHFC